GTPESRFGAGENLANWFGQPAQSDKGTLDSWYGEIDKYNFDAPVLCLGRTDDPPGCNGANGHFTQVVWKDTRQLGCARAACTQGGQQGTVRVGRSLPRDNYKANQRGVLAQRLRSPPCAKVQPPPEPPQPPPEPPQPPADQPNLVIDKDAGPCAIGPGDTVQCPFTI